MSAWHTAPMAEHDLVIRGGTVVDGTGAPRRTADVAITDGIVTEVGAVDGRGHPGDRRRRRARHAGLRRHPHPLRRPGHLGRAAPALVVARRHHRGHGQLRRRLRPGAASDHERLIELMEGVEDIPGAALHEGLDWGWRASPSTSTRVDRRPHDIDFAAQVPHAAAAALRHGRAGRRPRGGRHAGGDRRDGRARRRGRRRPARSGFTTSRTLNHRTSTGALHADPDRRPRASWSASPRPSAPPARACCRWSPTSSTSTTSSAPSSRWRASGRPLSFSLAAVPARPRPVPRAAGAPRRRGRRGLDMRAQVAPRAVGLLLGPRRHAQPVPHQPGAGARSPTCPLDRAGRPPCPTRSSAAGARGPRGGRAKGKLGGGLIGAFDRMFPLGDPPDYEPDPADAVRRPGPAAGVDPAELGLRPACSATTAGACSTCRS